MDRRSPLRLAAFAALGGAALVRLLAVTAGSPVVTPDTFDFAQQAREPVFSAGFWGAQHPPLLPLLWKLIPGPEKSVAPVQFGDLRPAVLLNAAVAAVCWSVLAVVVARLPRSRAVGAVAFAAVLAAGLAPEVVGWDAALLTESISLSLTALAVALLLLWVREPSRAVSLGLAATVVLWCAIRETNMPVALLTIGPLLFVVRRGRAPVVAALLVGTGLALWGQHAADQRWRVPARNSLAYALDVEHAAPWLRAHGMPLRANTVELLLERPTMKFETDPAAAELRGWLDEHGKATWYRYVLSHPGRALWRPVRDADEFYGAPRASIAPYLGARATSWSLFPGGAPLALLVGVLAVAGAFLARTRETLVAALLAASTVPLSLVIWNMDPFDVGRHALGDAVALRLALLVVATLVVDRLAAQLRGLNAAQSIPKYVGTS